MYKLLSVIVLCLILVACDTSQPPRNTETPSPESQPTTPAPEQPTEEPEESPVTPTEPSEPTEPEEPTIPTADPREFDGNYEGIVRLYPDREAQWLELSLFVTGREEVALYFTLSKVIEDPETPYSVSESLDTGACTIDGRVATCQGGAYSVVGVVEGDIFRGTLYFEDVSAAMVLPEKR